MNEASVRLKVRHALEDAGYAVTRLPDCIVCPRCKNKIIPEGGRADLTASPTESTVYVEVKTLRRDDTAFSFSEIRDDQREWLDGKFAAGHNVYLAIGIIRSAGERDRLEAMYLVHWFVWECLEGITKEAFGQESLPWIAGKGFSTKMQEAHWDIKHILASRQMVREDGAWRLPTARTSAAEVNSGELEVVVGTDGNAHYRKESGDGQSRTGDR